jgi:hypothetical protein
MSDFLRLKVLEHHYLLEIDVKRRKLGLPVSQHLPNMFPTFHCPCISRPHGPYGAVRHAGKWMDLIRITLEKHEEADLHLGQ